MVRFHKSMDSDAFLYLLLFGGAFPALIAAFVGIRRHVHIAGATCLLMLIAIILFAPSDPHPFIGGLAMMTLPSAVIGWLAGAVISMWRKPSQEFET